MDKRRMWRYVGVLLFVSIAAEILILHFYGLSNSTGKLMLGIVMLLPGISTVTYILITREGFRIINWKIKRPIYLLYAALIPALLSLLCMFSIIMFGLGSSTHFTLANGVVNIKRGMFILGKGNQSPIFFFVNYMVTALVFSVVNGIPAFGEELGWRGFLQKKLVNHYNIVPGIILLGLIWGFWHFPLIISGYNYPEYPVLGAFLLFPLTTVFSSFFLAWLTIRSQSLWPAVLAHGCVNTFYGNVIGEMDFGSHRLAADLVILIIWLITAVVSYLLLRKMRTTDAVTP